MPGCGGLRSALVLARQRLRSQQEPQRMPLHPDARRHGRTRFHVLSFPAGACFRAPDCIRALAHVTFFSLLVLTLCMTSDCMGVCVTVGSLLPGCPQASPDPDYYDLRPRTTSTCPRKALGDHTASVSYFIRTILFRRLLQTHNLTEQSANGFVFKHWGYGCLSRLPRVRDRSKLASAG